MEKISDTNVYILGGGRSSRMKKDKAFLEYEGKSLIDISIERAHSLFERVFLVGREYQSPLITRCIRDEVHGIGPIGGILTALKYSDRPHNFFIGMDYPCTDKSFILVLYSLFKGKSERYDGLIPVGPDGPHPLMAFYDTSCLPSVEMCITERMYRIVCIARRSRICFSTLLSDLEESGLAEAYPGEDARVAVERNLTNINSDRDYTMLKGLKKHTKKKL